MKLTASIVTFNTDLRELETVLGLLSESCVTTVYTVDNSRSERIRDITAAYPKAVYIPAENRGYGSGHNRAMAIALREGCDFHLVINSDVSFRPADISALVDYMEQRPDVGAVQPCIVGPDGTMHYTVRLLPTPIDPINRRFLPHWFLRRRNDRYELRHLDHSKEFNGPFHQGSFMLMRGDVLREVGLFDERYFMYAEDIDLTRRIHERYRTMYVPFVTVVHAYRRSSYHSLKMLAIHSVNMVRYFNKWGWFSDPGRRRMNAPLLPPR